MKVWYDCPTVVTVKPKGRPARREEFLSVAPLSTFCCSATGMEQMENWVDLGFLFPLIMAEVYFLCVKFQVLDLGVQLWFIYQQINK